METEKKPGGNVAPKGEDPASKPKRKKKQRTPLHPHAEDESGKGES